MKTIKEAIQFKILSLRVKHKLLGDSQMYLGGLPRASYRYNVIELKKAFLELNIAILCALIGESK